MTLGQDPFGSGLGGGQIQSADGATSLGDILERVLDRGLVIAGDIRVNLLDIELLTIKLRLVIASLETAKEVGIDWWEHDPWLRADAGRSGGGERTLEENQRPALTAKQEPPEEEEGDDEDEDQEDEDQEDDEYEYEEVDEAEQPEPPEPQRARRGKRS
ncbi:MAG TPA: gas vesicle protein [Actinocrinis sp.]|nr:gas vesicle protein [Actinocrinis sp.]